MTLMAARTLPKRPSRGLNSVLKLSEECTTRPQDAEGRLLPKSEWPALWPRVPLVHLTCGLRDKRFTRVNLNGIGLQPASFTTYYFLAFQIEKPFEADVKRTIQGNAMLTGHNHRHPQSMFYFYGMPAASPTGKIRMFRATSASDREGILESSLPDVMPVCDLHQFKFYDTSRDPDGNIIRFECCKPEMSSQPDTGSIIDIPKQVVYEEGSLTVYKMYAERVHEVLGWPGVQVQVLDDTSMSTGWPGTFECCWRLQAHVPGQALDGRWDETSKLTQIFRDPETNEPTKTNLLKFFQGIPQQADWPVLWSPVFLTIIFGTELTTGVLKTL